jgi:hypothetical protein
VKKNKDICQETIKKETEKAERREAKKQKRYQIDRVING